MGIELRYVTTGDGLGALEQEWDDLNRLSHLDNVFATHLWLSTWWECFGRGRDLLIITAWRGWRLVGLAPLVVSPREGFREATLMGGQVSDYKDVLIAEGDDRRTVLGSLMEAALSRNGVDLCTFNGLREDSPNFQALEAIAATQRVNGSVVQRYAGAPYIRITGAWNTYLHGLGSKMRKKTRQQLRKLTASYHDVSFEVVDDAERVRDTVSALLTLKTEQLERKKHVNIMDRGDVQCFYHLVAQRLLTRGLLRLYVLRVDGAAAAIDLGIEYGHKYYSCQHAYDTRFSAYSVGKLLDLHILEDGFDRGLREMDMLLGEEEYKLNYLPTVRHLYSLHAFGNSPRAKLAQAWFQGVRPTLATVTQKTNTPQRVRRLAKRLSAFFG